MFIFQETSNNWFHLSLSICFREEIILKLLKEIGKKCFKSSYYSLIIIIILFSLLDLSVSHLLKVDNPTSPTIGKKIEINKGFLSPKDIIITNMYNLAYLNSPPPQIRPPEIKVLSIATLSAYSESSPIFIDNNTDFEDKANSSGWIGNGSLSSPYIIANLNITITNPSGYLIEIRNTDVYFQIEKCLLIKGSRGIRLTNVSNGKISENRLGNSSYAGIELRDSIEINITSNTINNEKGFGIYSTKTNNSIIYNNSVFENEYDGIFFTQSNNSLFRKNWIYENGEEGVTVLNSNDNTFIENYVFNNTWEGIELSTTKNCSFSNNTCIENGEYAIKLSFSNDSSLINNTLDAVALSNSYNPKIVRNNIFGQISLQEGGYANISDNSITFPGDWAIRLFRFGQNYISNNYIFNSGGGIRFQNNCGNSTLSDLYITNCTFNRAIYLQDSSNSTITNITATNCGDGFLLYYSENCTVDQIYLKDLSGSGCTIYSSSYSNITNIYLKNTSNVGFSLEESNSSYIDNITVINSSSNGFSASQSNNCTLSNMDVNNTSGFNMNHARFNYIRNVNIWNASNNGLDLYGINMSVFEQFNVDKSREYGVEIESSYNLQFNECELKNNQYHGIRVYNSGEVNFNSCSSYNNGRDGFEIDLCSNSIFYKNYVFNNSDRGMEIINSISIEVIQSAIYGNAFEGIRLYGSEHGTVRHSIIFRNAYSGLILVKPYEEEYSGNNTITRNDFIANGFEGSESQIRSDITTEKVSYNFYDSHREPDDDSDGIIDIPYLIGENYEEEEYYYDNYPLSMPYNIATIHYVTQPIMIYPYSYNISEPYYIEPVQVSGTITVKWLHSIDSFDEELTYSLWIRQYSWEAEENWTIAVDGITSNSYDWDTTSIYKGHYYVKVVASHISGINVSSVIQEIQINNAPPELTDFYSSPGLTFLPILWFLGVIIVSRHHRKHDQ